MKSGAQSKGGGREGRHENVIKKPQSAIDVASERHEVSPGEGLMAHTDVSQCTTAAHRAPAGAPGCAPHGPTAHPHRQTARALGRTAGPVHCSAASSQCSGEHFCGEHGDHLHICCIPQRQA